MTSVKTFHYVELTAESLERAAAFYHAVFGWEFEEPPEEHTATGVIYFEGVPEVGLRQRGRAVRNGGVRPAVDVESIEATLASVEAAGGRVVEGAVDVGDGYTGFLEDTEGNVVGLWQF